MIARPEYINFLEYWKDKKIIKVISGIRRCGKSTMFDMFQSYLKKNGVVDNQIISINFEDMANEELRDYKRLYQYVQQKKSADKMNYVFLDEIQHVPNFEKVVDSLFIQNNMDVYITGSNAYFMSGELATLLSGRYIELKMLPLSFKEYCSAFKEDNIERLFRNYLYNSSFPYTTEMTDRRNIYNYLDGIFNTVVLNDIVTRRKIQDPLMLRSVIQFLFDNIGNLCTPKKIADTMVSQGRKISSPTIENYLLGITDSLLMYKVGRYDVKGKEYLKLQEKYYLADIGLRYYLLGMRDVDQGHILENIIYLELLRRGYRVYVGKIESAEIDFVAQDYNGDVAYFQVSWSVRDKVTLERELKPLNMVKDHHAKYLLTMDNDHPISYNGIKKLYALDWLLDK